MEYPAFSNAAHPQVDSLPYRSDQGYHEGITGAGEGAKHHILVRLPLMGKAKRQRLRVK